MPSDPMAVATLPFVLSRAAHASRQLFQRILAEANLDLTPEEAMAIMLIRRFDAGSVSRLAEGLGRDRTTTSRLVESLERKGLVQRQSQPTDRRATRVVVTARGQALETEISMRGEWLASTMVGDITLEELTTAFEVISKMQLRAQSILRSAQPLGPPGLPPAKES